MNCANHADVENIAFCIKCGKPLCAQCARQVQASVYCENCLADSMNARSAKKTARPAGGGSPEAAFILGLIPGVGAIYNAEFFKAAIHLLIFGVLITIADNARGPGSGLAHLMAFGFYVYMPFEAFYTAKKRKLALEGIALETPFDRLNEQMGTVKDKELWGGIVLVIIGALFLLDNFEVLELHQVIKLWPALLILGGVFLIRRFKEGKSE
jgi:hypothetical protein